MRKKSGIYKFTSPTGRVYIGSSVDLATRYSYYKTTNAPKQTLLNRSFKKYGFDNHIFEIVEECNADIRLDRERYYGELYKSLSDFGGLNLILPKSGEKPFAYSKELRAKFSEIAKNRKYTPETIEKFKKAKQGIYIRGKHPQAKLVLHTEYGIFYDCINDAAEQNGITRTLLSQKLSGTFRNNTKLIYA
jgi:group I intron endonuclease